MRTITISLMVLAVLVVGGMAIKLETVKAGYNYEEPLGPDIIDGLMQIPPHVAKQYGKTDKVRLVSNIAELLVTRNDHDARIKALEQLVKKLEAQVAYLEKVTDALSEGLLNNTRTLVKSGHPIIGKFDDPNEVTK